MASVGVPDGKEKVEGGSDGRGAVCERAEDRFAASAARETPAVLVTHGVDGLAEEEEEEEEPPAPAA